MPIEKVLNESLPNAKNFSSSLLTMPITGCRMKTSMRGNIGRVTEPQVERLVKNLEVDYG